VGKGEEHREGWVEKKTGAEMLIARVWVTLTSWPASAAEVRRRAGSCRLVEPPL
jgi:hypothetical protein